MFDVTWKDGKKVEKPATTLPYIFVSGRTVNKPTSPVRHTIHLDLNKSPIYSYR